MGAVQALGAVGLVTDEGIDRAGAVLAFVAQSIVDEPGAVQVDVDGSILRLHVAQGDMGKVIGRRGRVAQAIRTLVRAAGAKDGTDVSVDIVD